MAEGFVRVAPDSTGKYIRNVELLVQQPDGTYLVVEQQVITRATDDGRILDSGGLAETGREVAVRQLLEETLLAIHDLVATLGGPLALPQPPTVTQGDF
jgi:hypothetical protein